MIRKATLSAVVTAAAVALAPVPGVSAATTSPTTPVSVLQDLSAATGAPAGAKGAAPAGLAPLLIVTKDAAGFAPLAAPAAAPAAFALPGIPSSVTDALKLAGLPLANVFGVVQVGQGIYSVWFKLFTDAVPNAILKGQWGSVPGLFTKAIDDTFKVINPPPKATVTAADVPTQGSASSLIPGSASQILDIAGLPVRVAWDAVQVANRVYQNGYFLIADMKDADGKVTRQGIPNLFLTGQWDKIPTLIIGAIEDSVTTVVNFPKTEFDKVSGVINPPAPKNAGANDAAGKAVAPKANTFGAVGSGANDGTDNVGSGAPSGATGASGAPSTSGAPSGQGISGRELFDKVRDVLGGPSKSAPEKETAPTNTPNLPSSTPSNDPAPSQTNTGSNTPSDSSANTGGSTNGSNS